MCTSQTQPPKVFFTDSYTDSLTTNCAQDSGPMVGGADAREFNNKVKIVKEFYKVMTLLP